MIPVLLVAGLIAGRWWLVPAAGVAWSVLLVVVNDLGVADVPVAASLAMVNAAVGVALHKALTATFRYVRGLSAR